jgi:hypothetical protein
MVHGNVSHISSSLACQPRAASLYMLAGTVQQAVAVDTHSVRMCKGRLYTYMLPFMPVCVREGCVCK